MNTDIQDILDTDRLIFKKERQKFKIHGNEKLMILIYLPEEPKLTSKLWSKLKPNEDKGLSHNNFLLFPIV